MALAKKLSHDNLCKYFSMKQITVPNVHGEEEILEIAILEYIPGGSIDEYLQKHPQHRDSLLKDVLRGLIYLHSKGIIHSDISPSNILVDDSGAQPVAKIINSGFSKVMYGDIFICNQYMAPEQYRPYLYREDEKIDTRVNLWSFGMVAYELLSGKRMAQQLNLETEDWRIEDPNQADIDVCLETLAEPWRSVLQRCLVKHAAQRAKTADELLDLLNGGDNANNQKSAHTQNLTSNPVNHDVQNETKPLNYNAQEIKDFSINPEKDIKPRPVNDFEFLQRQLLVKKKIAEEQCNIFENTRQLVSVGIDFGNSYFCVSKQTSNVDNPSGYTVDILKSASGEILIPHMLVLDESGEIYFGENAKFQAELNPSGTVCGYTNLLGKTWSELTVSNNTEPNILQQLEKGDNDCILININKFLLSPEEVCSLVLLALEIEIILMLNRNNDSGFPMVPLHRSLAIPNSFTFNQRAALLKAGQLAGLNNLTFIQKTDAMASIIAQKYNAPNLAIVYLDTGESNASVHSIEDGVAETLFVAGEQGHKCLDVEDFIANWLRSEFNKEHGIELPNDPQIRSRLKRAATKAVDDLSDNHTANICMNNLLVRDTIVGKMRYRINTQITHEILEQAVFSYFRENVNFFKQQIDYLWSDAYQRDIEQIDCHVFLTGRYTQIPSVLNSLGKLYSIFNYSGQMVKIISNPEELISMGAAIKSGVYTGYTRDLVILSTITRPLCLSTLSGKTHVMIPACSSDFQRVKDSITFPVRDIDRHGFLTLLLTEGNPLIDETTNLISLFQIGEDLHKQTNYTDADKKFTLDVELNINFPRIHCELIINGKKVVG
ncbi:MAG: Hsp70 family protein [Bacteroidia bacterium]